ncbi:phenylalanine--tRNA ligase subunit beta [Corynebacterium neomassiliense]|uniref:phenylalanine--tRNA ligase subunit beta n=1 Tax=Corynebacterium neomassiliense TaxID=2079482 RepID=UPI001031E929|nr:phenylalanine--tRNA ligase subunit beta [Corynebacterium neomassiliense]
MLISQDWLTRLLRTSTAPFSVTSEEMDAGFVRVGFETEGFRHIERSTGPVVFGRVVDFEELEGFKKPIRYCEVDVADANGTGEPQHIICGARNFRKGDTVVVSLPGAVLPGGFEIAARKTYGKVSEGMMCSAAELGLASVQTAGIIALRGAEAADPRIVVGQDARGFLGLDDTVFEVNITPDRGYALSARGLARELASSFGLTYRDPALDPAAAALPTDLLAGLPSSSAPGALPAVTVDPDTKASRFGIRGVTGIDPTVESPYWMQRELLLCGQRPVNAATDVTNYVMFLLGQPMHAFDAGRITGDLHLRRAAAGEKLTTLDGVERTLSQEDVVICDATGIQSLAGVMGGSTSEITPDTTDVYFEAAHFDQITVARTSRRHRLSSEASRRFERGTDPATVEAALDFAVALLSRIAGGTVMPGSTIVGGVPEMPVIAMHTSAPGRTAGMVYPSGTTVGRLTEVGCSVTATGERDSNGAMAIEVTPPTWRPDLTMPADLVEEVLRLEGLGKIPSVIPTAPAGRGLTPRQRMRRAVGHALAWNGWLEILPGPFIPDNTFDVWGLDADDPRRNAVRVLNPLESDVSTIGTTLLPSMIDSLRRNITRGQKDLGLFGVEQVTLPTETSGVSPMPSTSGRPSEEEIAALAASLPRQPLHVSVIAAGARELQGTWGPARPYTAADAFEAARVIGRAAGVDVSLRNAAYLPWHPGRCAEILVEGDDGPVVVGHAGELHPQVCERADLPPRTVALEIDLDAVPTRPRFPRPVLSPFPALYQDVAVVVDETTPAADVEAALVEGAGSLLESLRLFDEYRSDTLGEGKRSLTYSLRFRAPDRTLTEDEASRAREAAVASAAQKVGAVLRA